MTSVDGMNIIPDVHYLDSMQDSTCVGESRAILETQLTELGRLWHAPRSDRQLETPCPRGRKACGPFAQKLELIKRVGPGHASLTPWNLLRANIRAGLGLQFSDVSGWPITTAYTTKLPLTIGPELWAGNKSDGMRLLKRLQSSPIF
jgi:hypothetical protein